MPQAIDEFRKTDRRQTIANAIALVSGCLVLWMERGGISGSHGLRGGWMSVTGFVFLFGAIIFSFWNWRCSACHSYLGHNGIRNRCCYKCGVQLRDKQSWYEHPWVLPVALALAGLIIGILVARGRFH